MLEYPQLKPQLVAVYICVWYRSNATSHSHDIVCNSTGLLKRLMFVNLEQVTKWQTIFNHDCFMSVDCSIDTIGHG